MNGIVKSSILNMIGAKYGNPKKMFADCKTKIITIMDFDGTERTDTAEQSSVLEKLAITYGFREITKIGIEFETQIIIFKGIDNEGKTKTLKM